MNIERASNLILRNVRIVDPLSGVDKITSIHIVDGSIKAIGSSLSAAKGAVVRECEGMVAAPGFFDMHVHLREPGFEHKETVETGCMSAAAGGFTGVSCMPNTNPAIDDESVVRMIRAKARDAVGGLVDVHPIAAVSLGRKGERLAPLAELAAAGAVAFTDDGDPVHDAEIMRRALEYASMFNKPIIQHAQDMPMTRGGVMNEGFCSTELGLPGMPGAAEDVVIARDITLSGYTGGQYHVAHMSTGGAVELIRMAKSRGLRVTCEVTPHHFVLTDDAVRTFDTNTKMNPPLRSADDVAAILAGLKDGTIDVIATDHAPHSYDEKQVEYQAAPFGIIGLETAIGLTMTALVHKKVITIERMVQLLSVNPRAILHLPEIRVTEGSMANLTLFHPDEQWVVDPSRFYSRSRNTPFGGSSLKGRPVGAINNGVVFFHPHSAAS
ncbi:MAG: dihydroorotase [Ignavibacteria bacterium]|nr:dihydroorotase [Ignavibacteria bacterium]